MKLYPFKGNQMERSAESVITWFGIILVLGCVIVLAGIGGLIWWAVS